MKLFELRAAAAIGKWLREGCSSTAAVGLHFREWGAGGGGISEILQTAFQDFCGGRFG